MAEKFDLIADFREDNGKGASRRLRREGKVPAIIYGAGRPPRALSFDHNKVLRELQNESFYSSVLNIKVGDKSQAAIVKDIQRHPTRRDVLHVDFIRLDPNAEVEVEVPVILTGEARNVTQVSGMVDQVLFTLAVYSKPNNIPTEVTADITDLEVNATITVAALSGKSSPNAL